MLALCFLVLDKIECEDIWAQWLQGHEDDFTIVIHSKKPYVPKTDLFNEKATIIPTIPTRWGDFSLVQATIRLFEQAIIIPEVTHCILLSGSCIPLKPFNVIKEQLTLNSYVSASLPVSDKRYSRVNQRLQRIFNNSTFESKKHHQWVIAYREHIQLVLEEESLINEIYMGTRFSDESWFLTFLHLKNRQNEVISQNTTFTNWSEGGCHPKIYLEISDEELFGLIANPEYFFGRKFTENTCGLGLLLENTT